MSEIYYVQKPYFKEAIRTFSFRNKINWLEEGLSVLSWKYSKVSCTDVSELNKIYSNYRAWNGNKTSRIAGHRSISIGDIIVVGDNSRIVIGGGFEIIPYIVWKKIIKQ